MVALWRLGLVTVLASWAIAVLAYVTQVLPVRTDPAHHAYAALDAGLTTVLILMAAALATAVGGALMAVAYRRHALRSDVRRRALRLVLLAECCLIALLVYVARP